MVVLDLTSQAEGAAMAGLTWRAEVVKRALAELPAVLADQVQSVWIREEVSPLTARVLAAAHGIEPEGTDVYGYVVEDQRGYSIQLYWNPVMRPHSGGWWALRWGLDDPGLLTVTQRLRVIVLDLFAELARRLELPQLQDQLREEAYELVARTLDIEGPEAPAEDDGELPGTAPGATLDDVDEEALRSYDWDRAFREHFGW